MRARRFDVVLGAIALLAVGALVLVAVLAYNRTFVRSDSVTLQAGALGNALQRGSDVKLNGVPVGWVSSITPIEGGANLQLDLDPSVMSQLPPDTTARLLPKTLFGERFVSLVRPTGTAGGGLETGDTIHEDMSAQAVELQQVFDELLPLLHSIQPEKLAATLGELASTLRGRGDDIGAALTAWASYLSKLNPHVPALAEDLGRLASVARTYDEAAPELIDALATMTTTTQTLVEERGQLQQVYSSVIGSANTTRGWVADNRDTIEVLAVQSRAALEAVRPYASEFPCVFKAARQFIPRMDKVLGKGTREPGFHARMSIVKARAKYLPGKDAPRYASGASPRCPYVTGQTGTRVARADESGPPSIPPPPSELMQDRLAPTDGLGPANSSGENQLIAELLAPEAGVAPAEYPAWASLLLGPLMRGKGVVLR
ncbi:MCE family protein [Nocardioides marmoriginsengisoli]|uniref:MCE family protein n=1 Tax=Nocardioides marmoriginsengisoli TaxID=661483 RepID=A0A3N0CN02_9ACTN|nr:MCE family protein [Nocardioides marmoriginsengisoli]RNL64838.1 MCE family protein [Nocardioides marmoriginsengisoli]